MNPRTILIIHQAFPGQFGTLARTLAKQGHRVFALALNPQERVEGVRIIRYAPVRAQDTKEMPYLDKEMDSKLLRAESVYKVMAALKKQGLEPDVIYAHPGWGEAMFVRDVWPKARFVVYAEWFYHATGQEVNFDPAVPALTEEETLRLAIKNTPFLHGLSDCDAAIAPTNWQKSRYPAWAWDKIRVIHDGLDLQELAQVRPRGLGIPSQGLKLRKGMPIVTYSARHLEPVRGFHYFMRALPKILAANPQTHVVIMGRDAGTPQTSGYGADNPSGLSWRRAMEKELAGAVDFNRVHFLGMLERRLYLSMLKLSACHVYLTTPFILSWSFLEAAALGVPIVASNTPPVMEFDNLDGIEYVGFNEPDALAARVVNRLNNIGADYSQSNMKKLANMDFSHTIPAITEVLVTGSRGRDNDSVVEDLVIIDDDE